MSIKKSLRLSMIALSALPIIFMAILIYVTTLSEYIDLAKQSAQTLAKDYTDGVESQLDTQVAQLESLSGNTSVQGLTLDYYNGVSSSETSAYYNQVDELLTNTSLYLDNAVQYYLYDINGYNIASSTDKKAMDWFEYMSTPIQDITETVILPCDKMNEEHASIELVTPIQLKGKTIGLLRADISKKYFDSFLPDDDSAFILTSKGEYLFKAKGFNNKSQEKAALKLFSNENSTGYISESNLNVNSIMGYGKLTIPSSSDGCEWIYFISPDSSHYEKILSQLPITFLVTLTIILIISIYVSGLFAKKYTDPILTLRDNMTEAANGNLSINCDIKSSDEFGQLSDSFNAMMNIISNNYNELSEQKKVLEANDIEIRKSYSHIEQLAYHDGLTGLYNRVAFMKYAYDIFKSDGLALNRHAIFFIDLDNFKNVNDTLGHDYGDLLLKQVADNLSKLIDDTDILARTGGDEFLIFKANYSSQEVLIEYATHLVNIVNEPFDLNGETAHVSMSVGVATFPHDGLTINELIKNADIAMYNAKTSGKNAYRFFNSYMEDDFNRKNDLAEILSNVIEKNEVYLMYQPQVCVQTGRITGYEALMRIESEVAGYIPPSEFIPIAEDSGTINQLGEWALYEACSFNQTLINSGFGDLKVSVNVSTTQLQDNRFMNIIKAIPEKTGMPLTQLEIEITESVLMNSFEHNLELINEMKSMGVSIALDDFGTGYSSFNYLTQIPIDTLKIDKSFIDGICSNDKDKCIADSIISLAHKMNISVVAEGVEDTEQLSVLQEQFCDTLQGYLFSKPLRASDLISLLDTSKHQK